MKPIHTEKVLNKYKLGVQILFEHNLEVWQNSLGISFNESPSSRPPSSSSIPDSFSDTNSSRSCPYARINTSEPSSTKNISFCSILNETTRGLMLVDYYNKHSRFQDEQRLILINNIAQYFEDKKVHMSLSSSHRLEKEIIERFPTEKLVILISKHLFILLLIRYFFLGILSYGKKG